jgi:PIN domain nuclease of toxin-antitoxin system
MILLDTHFVIELVEADEASAVSTVDFAKLMTQHDLFASAVSLWEIAIKYRLGKLNVRTAVSEWPGVLAVLGVKLLPIEISHVLEDVSPKPATKDPFDNLLLGICAVENLALLTIDRALINHPLAWRVGL